MHIELTKMNAFTKSCKILTKFGRVLKCIFYIYPKNWILCKRYPFLFVDSKYEEFWSGRYERTWLDFLPIGWQKRFGMKLVHDIDKYIKDNNITNYHIDDVKQMFGMLYWYDNGDEGLKKLINNYIFISKNVCVNCGADTNYVSTGYVLPYCNECAEYMYLEGKITYRSAYFRTSKHKQK